MHVVSVIVHEAGGKQPPSIDTSGFAGESPFHKVEEVLRPISVLPAIRQLQPQPMSLIRRKNPTAEPEYCTLLSRSLSWSCSKTGEYLMKRPHRHYKMIGLFKG